MIQFAKYCLVTPCRNEVDYARRTLESVVRQSILPAKWVIVDDGSTDGTSDILREYAEKYSFIEIHKRADRGVRQVGPGVIEAFYDGLRLIDVREFEYICKFDLDLEIGSRYFEILIGKMNDNPRLGTCSGKPYFPHPITGELVSEECGDEMSVGMTKFYRVSCFEDIGGFVREVMWDGIDCHTCRMKGWLAGSWDEPELRFLHLRAMGSSHKGILTGRQRHGFGQYFMGTGILYMIASAVFRMSRPPIVFGGASMLYGYLRSMLLRVKRYDNAEFIRFLRKYQFRCLLIGKARATAELNARILADHG